MAAPKSNKARTDWYQVLTNQTVEGLEECLANPVDTWQKMWAGMNGLPRNGLTGRFYNGLNVWFLAWALQRLLKRLAEEGRQVVHDPRWYTFDQAMQAVGYKRNPKWKGRKDTFKGIKKWLWNGEGPEPKGLGVRKGEKGVKVFYWRFIKKYENRATGKAVRKPTPEQIASGEVKLVGTIPFLKIHTVFNANQIEGLESIDIPDVDPGEKYIQAQCLVDLMPGLNVRHIAGSDMAGYNKHSDEVLMPAPGQFDSIEHYWATVLHEMTHWTGHENRLDRDLSNRFGSDAYAFEELVAELGSVFLCAHLGIEGNLQHPQYLASWIRRMKEDKYAVFKAASLAQKAVDFILAGGAVESEDDKTSDVDPDDADTTQARAA